MGNYIQTYYFSQSRPRSFDQYPYFKLLESRWARALVDEGQIRITTIERCRKIYEAGPGRVDGYENMLFPEFNTGVIRWIPQGREHEQPFSDWITKQGFRPSPKQLNDGSLCVIKDQPGFWFDIRDDLYVYCVTHYQSRRMEIRFASGDDSWVEIIDPPHFFGAIDDAMKSRGHTPKGLKSVSYRSRHFPRWESLPQDSELIKDPRFVSEQEARACWVPATRPLDVIDLVIPELRKYCRMQRKAERTCIGVKNPNAIELLSNVDLQYRRPPPAASTTHTSPRTEG
jgi:hypothetical protein